MGITYADLRLANDGRDDLEEIDASVVGRVLTRLVGLKPDGLLDYLGLTFVGISDKAKNMHICIRKEGGSNAKACPA